MIVNLREYEFIELQTGKIKRRISIVIQLNSDFLHFIKYSIRMSNKLVASVGSFQSQGDLKLYSNEELRKMRRAIHKRPLDPASEIL